MSERARHYTLRQTIDKAVDDRLASVHVAIPAKVTRYDETKQQLDAQPLVQIVYTDEAGERQVEDLPVVVNVPAIFPGSGGYRITFPVEVEDTVLLVFAESSIDRWLESGKITDPADDRRFHLSDGVAVLGLRDFSRALASAPLDRMTLGKDDGVQIHMSQNVIKLGSNEASELDSVGCGGAILAALQDIQSKLGSHTHPVAGITPGPGAVTSGPSTDAGIAIGHIESEYVKVKK